MFSVVKLSSWFPIRQWLPYELQIGKLLELFGLCWSRRFKGVEVCALANHGFNLWLEANWFSGFGLLLPSTISVWILDSAKAPHWCYRSCLECSLTQISPRIALIQAKHYGVMQGRVVRMCSGKLVENLKWIAAEYWSPLDRQQKCSVFREGQVVDYILMTRRLTIERCKASNGRKELKVLIVVTHGTLINDEE